MYATKQCRKLLRLKKATCYFSLAGKHPLWIFWMKTSAAHQVLPVNLAMFSGVINNPGDWYMFRLPCDPIVFIHHAALTPCIGSLLATPPSNYTPLAGHSVTQTWSKGFDLFCPSHLIMQEPSWLPGLEAVLCLVGTFLIAWSWSCPAFSSNHFECLTFKLSSLIPLSSCFPI